MSVHPRFTVLLPTHNRADVVGLAIESVLAQTERDFELLVVGDGCTDDTGKVVTAFKDPRIKWLDLPKAPGFGYANRNLALREATGELIAFMAHDDLMLPDHLALLTRVFESPHVEWAYSRPLWVTDDGVVIPFAVDLRVPDQLAAFLMRSNSIPASCVVYRRSVHDRVGMWSEDVPSSGDWELWKRMLAPAEGTNLAYVRQPTILHFRADWRTVDEWGPPPLAAWQVFAAGTSWPAVLQSSVARDASPQAGMASALRGDGATAALRRGVDEALDRLAWGQADEIARLHAELGQVRYAVRSMPFQRAIRLQRRIQVRLGRNVAARVGSVLPAAYSAANPDVQASTMDPLEHYYVYGMLEGRPTR